MAKKKTQTRLNQTKKDGAKEMVVCGVLFMRTKFSVREYGVALFRSESDVDHIIDRHGKRLDRVPWDYWIQPSLGLVRFRFED